MPSKKSFYTTEISRYLVRFDLLWYDHFNEIILGNYHEKWKEYKYYDLARDANFNPLIDHNLMEMIDEFVEGDNQYLISSYIKMGGASTAQEIVNNLNLLAARIHRINEKLKYLGYESPVYFLFVALYKPIAIELEYFNYILNPSSNSLPEKLCHPFKTKSNKKNNSMKKKYRQKILK